jgi:AraC-like DNA-binding protein
MNASIFNFHDLVLIISSAGAFFLGAFLLLFPKKNKPSRKFLAGFFFCESLTNALHLFFWHSLLRQFSIENSEVMTFIYTTVSLSKGAMLYFYVLSILDNQFVLSRKQIGHLLASPALAGLAVLSGFGVLHIAAGVSFVDVDQPSYCFAGFLYFVPWCYSLLCFRELSRMDAVLRGFYASPLESGSAWFQLLVCGYIGVWSWHLFTQLFSGYLSTLIDGGLPNVFGLITNYLQFGLIFALYAYSVSKAYNRLSLALDKMDSVSSLSATSQTAASPSPPNTETAPIQNSTSTPESEADKKIRLCTLKITEAMNHKKIYLDHSINLERVSTRIGERPKDVSHILHTVFKTNFFEFINGHRVEEAKRLLIEHQELSVNEVMERAGFSSKSAFHRVFKSATEQTPCQFRNDHRVKQTQVESEERVPVSI